MPTKLHCLFLHNLCADGPSIFSSVVQDIFVPLLCITEPALSFSLASFCTCAAANSFGSLQSLIICTLHQILLGWSCQRHEVAMGESGDAYKILIVKLEGKRPRGRRRCRLEDNIRMDLREIDHEVTD